MPKVVNPGQEQQQITNNAYELYKIPKTKPPEKSKTKTKLKMIKSRKNKTYKITICVCVCVYWHFVGPGQLEWRWAEKVIDVAPEACQKYEIF